LSHFKKTLLAYLLTAIRASFGKKLRAQEEPKSLPPDVFPGLQICKNCFCGAGRAYSAPPDPIAGLRGLLLREGKGDGRGRAEGGKRRGRGGKARGGEGREGKLRPPLLKFLDPPADYSLVCYLPRIVLTFSCLMLRLSL